MLDIFQKFTNRRVFHFTQNTINSGAGIACKRLHQQMIKLGIDSNIVTLKTDLKKNVIKVKPIFLNSIIFFLERILIKLLNLESYSISIFGFYNFNNFLTKNDILVIHWTQVELISLSKIKKLSEIFEIYLFLHDEWWLTSGYHYQNSYSKNNLRLLNRPFSLITIFENKSLEIKNKISEKVSFIAPSKWLCSRVNERFPETPTYHLPNFCSDNFFKINNRNIIIKKYNYDIKLINLLIVAENLFDKRKGSDILFKSLSKLPDHIKNLISINTVGKVNNKFTEELKKLKIKFNLHGLISDEITLNEIYNINNILIFPTRMDNYPNIILEAKQTQIEIISFCVGGVEEMLKNYENGFLIEKPDHILLSNKIKERIKEYIND